MLCFIGLRIPTPSWMPVLVWMSILAPITVPLCIFGLYLLIESFVEMLEKIGLHRHTNTNQDTPTIAAVEEHTLQPGLREPPNTNGVHSFHTASLPMYLYDKEAIEGGLVCPICKELFEKRDVMIDCCYAFTVSIRSVLRHGCKQTWRVLSVDAE